MIYIAMVKDQEEIAVNIIMVLLSSNTGGSTQQTGLLVPNAKM